MKRTNKVVIFFVLVFLLFFLALKAVEYWMKKHKMHTELLYFISAGIYTLLIVSIFFLAKLDASSEGFWDITPAARCQGGPYMWQGDSEEAKMCRAMASTPEGIVAISGYNCPTGYEGRPGLPFYYTPLSDSNWENERCADIPDCPLVDTGMCSLQKQIP